MALVKNPPTNYAELDERTLASKSGKTPFDAALLVTLKRIADALDGVNDHLNTLEGRNA